MLDKTKTDKNLGLKIHNFLLDTGVETPTIDTSYNDEHKLNLIETKFSDIMHILGLNLNDDSLKETPRRMSKMYVNELFWGLNPENFPKITTVENKMKYDEMLIEKNIKVNSVCEHHFVTIWGDAHVAYIPKHKVIGLSKLNRVVEYFSRRPQIQERLTEQIYYALKYILETDDIAIVIAADHFCVKSRGVEDINSHTITSKLGGGFMSNNILRQEFINFIK
jgi:GTP cyclohydrolase IA